MSSDKRIRVMSANLWNTRAEAEAFADMCDRLDVDIVCVQELASGAADALDAIFPYGELHPRDDFSGIGIALRYPAKLRPLPIYHKDGQIAELGPEDWPQLSAPLQVMNLHFAAPGPRRAVYSLLARRKQLAGFLEFVERNQFEGNRLLLGDFNSTPLWPLYRQISRRWTDLHREAAGRAGDRPARTWGPTAGSPRLLRIDHGFGAGVRAAAASVVPIEGSDHSALILDIEETH